jgi:AraC-like DNA-binding protein
MRGEEHIMKLEDLALNSNTSIVTLHRQFRQFLNTSPIKYFIDCKLEKAKLLLANHFYSIREIAELLSYSSPQFFAKEFKKKYGISPSEYRRSIKKDG